MGLYFYPNSVIEIAKDIETLGTWRLEITTVNQTYLDKHQLRLQTLSRGFAWLDTGTHEAMSEATEFVKAVEKRTGLKIACLEEIAHHKMKYITKEQLKALGHKMGSSSYAAYLNKL